MNPNREREEAIFEAAREIMSAKEREAFLAKMCGQDGELRKRIESMLEADAAAGEFFKTRQATVTATVDSPVPTEKVGDKIGRYKLLQKLGEGGCGVVYMAEQTEPVKRRVAIKVIKLGMDTKAVVARFEAERQALALMDHANIARVLDAGATDTGRPYFVMELVRGIRITDFCDQANLSTQERLGLFIQICQAVQHAHQKGIIHRDLKPSNILVTINDGVPVPKVIDFGIAKATTGQQLTDKTLFTAYEQFIGTPAYMSPEQAVMTSLDIDTRTDIYSLGVLLYEMLVGRTPFDAQDLLNAGLDEMRRKIREEEPLRPSTRLSTMLAADLTTVAKQHGAEAPALINHVRGDLDWIVMKALEKDRGRRYETANGLAMDILRHLNSEPVVARPPSQLYRLQKFARRNKTAFAASVAVAAALLIGLTVSAWQAIRATRAQRSEEKARLAADQFRARESEQRAMAQESARKAVENERITQRLLYAADMKLAHQAWEEGNLSRVHSLLGAHRPKTGEADTRGFEYFCLEELAKGEQEHTLQGHTNSVCSLAVSPDGRWLASRGKTDTRLWDLRQRRQVAVWASPPTRLPGERNGFGQGISFSHDSSYLALEDEAGLQLCEIPTLQVRLLSTGLAKKPMFSPVTNWIAFNSTAASGFQVKVWDYLSDKPVGTTGPGSYLWCWSADGSKLLTGLSGGTVGHVDWWDVLAGKRVATHRAAQYIFGASVSPDGKMTAAADWQGDIWLLESEGGKVLGSLPCGDIRPSALAFSPDSRFLATPSQDQAILVWDLESWKRVRQLRGHEGKVSCLAYGPDGKLLASGGVDGAVMLWDPTRETRQTRIPNWITAFGLNPPRFSPDGKWLALSTGKGGDFIDILDSSSLQTKVSLQGEFASFSPDSSQVAVASGSSAGPTLSIFRIGAPAPRATVLFDSSHGPLSLPRMSADGKYLAAYDRQYESTFLFEAATGERLITLPGPPPDLNANCFLPDGRTWVHAAGSHISCWNLQSLRKEFGFESPSPAVTLTVSPDGRFLAIARLDLSISLWDLGSRAELGILTGHQAIVWTLAFSPDGRTVASASEDRTIKLWDLATRREVASMLQDRAVYWVSFSPDGQKLVSGGIGSYQIWQAPRGDFAGVANEVQPTPRELPTNSLWRLPDGQAPTSPRILADKEQCFTNLLKIHAAIMAYRQDHQQMPDWLTNLVPAYLSDTNVLICPEHARTGGQPTINTSENYPRATPYYTYGFSAEANTSRDPDGLAASGDTLKDLRNKQLALYGEVIPVVKCNLHRTSLFVTYSGARMEGTSEVWKFAAVKVLPPAELEKYYVRLAEQGNADRLNELAYHWATAKKTEERDGKAALRFAKKAVELTNAKNPDMVDTLAAAYAESGAFDEAVRLQLEAISMLKLDPNERRIPEFESRLELYRRHEPARE